MGKKSEKIRLSLFVFILWTVFLLVGCSAFGEAEISAKSMETMADTVYETDTGQVSAQVPSAGGEGEQYQQFALYIWQGLREYGIEGSFTAWFQKPEEGVQVVVLEKGDEKWLERLFFEVDKKDGWLTILPSYEPVMCGEPGNKDYLFYYQDEDEINQVLQRPDYQMVVDQSRPLSIVTRFDRPSGMRIRDEMSTAWSFDHPANLYPHEYQLWDERKGSNIHILYPQMLYEPEDIGRRNEINRMIRDSFFYGYEGENNKDSWNPKREMWITIDRSYMITKNTKDCISMRIYESNDSRRAIHPNEWETGLSVNLETGEKISLSAFLSDTIGRQVTLDELLACKAFQASWFWSDSWGEDKTKEDMSREWIDKIREDYKQYGYTLEDMEDSFYLTETGLGLITFQGRYYSNIEAELGELKKALADTE